MTWKPIAFFSAHLVLAVGWILAIYGAIIGIAVLITGISIGSLKYGLLAGLVYSGMIGGPGIVLIALGRFTRKHTEPPADETPPRRMRRGADVFWVGLIGLMMVLTATVWRTLQWFGFVN